MDWKTANWQITGMDWYLTEISAKLLMSLTKIPRNRLFT